MAMKASEFRDALFLVFGRRNVRQAARHFTVHENTIDRWKKMGPPIHIEPEVKNLLRLTVADIEDLLLGLEKTILPSEDREGVVSLTPLPYGR